MTPAALPQALEVYLQHPLDDGEAVLLLPDEAVCLELGALPDADDVPARVAELVERLHTPVVLLGVARRHRRARPADLLLWTELCAQLDPAATELLPLQVLPAAS